MPFPANPLETALAGARAGDTSSEQLLAALADQPLWVPLPGGADPAGPTRLPVMALDGRPFVAVYTSAEQYARGAGAQPHMEITGRKLAELMAAELGLAVNPGAELGLPVNPEGVQVIRGGRRQVPAGARLRLGEPDPEPTELLTALAAAFTTVPAVIEARRALAQIGDQPPALLIGVRPDPTVPSWRQDILDATQPYPVDTTFLDEDDSVSRWMLTRTEPFYTRR
ncbi:enhanced serine sensitivity protein SseB [Actinoplanes sp. NPDC049596]|uniref:enhanced serine sensitivity protein SseB n=1 Tax=unclassified Actinoplanes TaxID=2626549 RepID=UPI003435C8E6